METWLAMLLIVAAVTLIVWYAWRKDRRRERAEAELPDVEFDAPAARSVGSGRGSRASDHDRHEGDAGDSEGGGGDGGGGGGD